jgi:anti-anti-sigma regulatory factor
MSELSFADTASIRVLLCAAGTLRNRGDDLVLLRPQRVLARMLEVMDAGQLITVRGEAGVTPEPGQPGEPSLE